MNAFHVVGALFAAWAVLVAVLGIRREGFPGGRTQGFVVGTISVVLALGAISTAIYTAATEEHGGEEEAHAERSEQAVEEGREGERPAENTFDDEGEGTRLELRADPSGDLKFDKAELTAPAGPVIVEMENPAEIEHDVSLEGRGVDERGKVVGKGGTSTVTVELAKGEYTYYCSVPGHRQGGMEGTLTVE